MGRPLPSFGLSVRYARRGRSAEPCDRILPPGATRARRAARVGGYGAVHSQRGRRASPDVLSRILELVEAVKGKTLRWRAHRAAVVRPQTWRWAAEAACAACASSWSPRAALWRQLTRSHLQRRTSACLASVMDYADADHGGAEGMHRQACARAPRSRSPGCFRCWPDSARFACGEQASAVERGPRRADG